MFTKQPVKDSTVHIRMDAEEKAMISELSALAGIKPSEFIRQSLRHSLRVASVLKDKG